MGAVDYTMATQQSFLGPNTKKAISYGPMGAEGSNLIGTEIDPSQPINTKGGWLKKTASGTFTNLDGSAANEIGSKPGNQGTITGYSAIANDPFGLYEYDISYSPEDRAKNALDYYNSVASGPMDFAGVAITNGNTAATYYNDPRTQAVLSAASAPAVEAPAVETNVVDTQIKKSEGTKVKRPPATILNSLSPQGKNLLGN